MRSFIGASCLTAIWFVDVFLNLNIGINKNVFKIKPLEADV